ncbi:MAG: gliding motility protein GldB [Prevotella sp.]|nr:gliding motility protein GldB [Prevotella sp.]
MNFKSYALLLFAFIFLSACQWKLKPNADEEEALVKVKRYDRIESLYLTTGDFSALQQMETDYPMETRTLIENVLKLGTVNDHEINNRFLAFFQNPKLQTIISDAEAQYANMDDINQQLQQAFKKLCEQVPGFPIPEIYSQITALDQSIIIGDGTVGISLDKYLGQDYELYKEYYNDQQRVSMNRKNIVPDCISFYLISLYPMHDFEARTQEERDIHMGKMMWVTNYAIGKRFFNSDYVKKIDTYMMRHPSMTIEQLLKMNDYSGMGI